MRILCNKEIISDDFQKISKAIQCVIKHQNSQPNLREIAHSIGLNLRYFQSMFRRWVGVSPEEFLKHVTIDNAREHLKTRGSGLEFIYGFHPSFFGEVIVVISNQRLCGLGFTTEIGRNAALVEQKAGWENGKWRHDNAATQRATNNLLNQTNCQTLSLSLLF